MTALLKLENALTVLKLGGAVAEKLTIAELASIHHHDLQALGFGRCDDYYSDTEDNMMLCPPWMLDVLASGEELTDFFGVGVVFGKEPVVHAMRNGLIPYGFVPDSLRTYSS